MAENINININAKDNASSTIGKVKTNLTGLSAAAAATQKGVIGLGSAFNGLKTIVAGLALGSVVTSAFRLADGMVDLSNATNLSTQSILGFSEAVALNGGDMASAQQALTKFTQTLGDAKNGVDSAEDTFAKLGVSISELQTLSEQDILRQTIQGLGNIDNAARRSATSVDVFGRSFAGVDIKSVNEQLDGFIRRSGVSASAIKNAGEVQGRLNDSFAKFQIQLLTALEPLSKLALSITDNTEAISKFLKVAIEVGIVIAGLFGANLIGKGVTALGTGLRTAATGMGAVGEALRLLKKGATEFGEVFNRLKKGTGGSIAQLIKQFGFMVIQIGRLLAPLVAATYAGVQLGLALRGITKEEGRLQRIVDRVADVRTEMEQLTTVAQANQAVQNASSQIEQLTAQYEALRAEQTLVGKSWDSISSRFGAVPELTALEEQLDYYYDLRNVAKLRAEELKNTVATQGDSVELSQQELEIERERESLGEQQAEEAARQMQNTIDTIAGLKEELMLLGLTERQQAIYNATKEAGTNATLEELSLINSIAGELYDLTEIREQDAEATEAQVQAQQEMNQAIAQLTESYQDAISGAEAFVKNKEQEYEFQNKINESYGAARDFLEEMAEFDRERISNLEALKVAAEEAFAKGKINAMEEYDDAVRLYELKRQQFEELARLQAEINNSATKGAKDAMANIGAQFTPYKMAQQAIQDTWNKIGSAVDEFIETGKFSFKDFARSVIADLGAMIAKAMIFKAIQTAFAAFGVPLPGLAMGGSAQAGQPYIVGEKGPELFVPGQSGTVIPNNKINSGSGSQAQPSNVTNNVYNISAVDAKSVAALFYENRRALLGTMNVAQKELPYGAMG